MLQHLSMCIKNYILIIKNYKHNNNNNNNNNKKKKKKNNAYILYLGTNTSKQE